MESVISATDLARQLGDVLGRVRYRGESFVIQRNGVVIARLLPAAPDRRATLAEAFRRWRAAGKPEPEFAETLERVAAADRVPENPWGS
jgi:prevent-host-death family protein